MNQPIDPQLLAHVRKQREAGEALTPEMRMWIGRVAFYFMPLKFGTDNELVERLDRRIAQDLTKALLR